MPPASSRQVSRGDTLVAIQDFSMKLFQLTAVITVLLLGWFLWGILSGSLADVPKRSVAEQKMVLQTIENISYYLNISLIINLIAGAICFYDEQTYPVILLIIAGFLMYGLQYAIDSMFGNSQQLVAGKASQLSLQSLHRTALTIAVPGVILLIVTIVQGILSPEKLDLNSVSLGRGAAAQQSSGGLIGAFAPCWQLPFCRESVRKNCPIFHAKTKCWKQGVGCMCEQSILQLSGTGQKQEMTPEELQKTKGFVAIGDLIEKSDQETKKTIPTRIGPRGIKIPINPNITPEQARERCKGCIIYTEHQRKKYNFFAPLVTLTVPLFVFWQFEALQKLMGDVIGKFDTMIGHVALSADKVTNFSQKITGAFGIEMVMVICAGLVMLTWALRFLEYCIFKIKI